MYPEQFTGESFVLASIWLTPEQTIMFESEDGKGVDKKFKGIITSLGGKTSHAVVVARGASIPCLIADAEHVNRIQPGDKVEITPDGVVHVNGGDANFVKKDTMTLVSAAYRFVYSNGEGRIAKIDPENINAPGTGHPDLLNSLLQDGFFSYDDLTTVTMGYINDDGSVTQDETEIPDQDAFVAWTEKIRLENGLPLGSLKRVDITAYV